MARPHLDGQAEHAILEGLQLAVARAGTLREHWAPSEIECARRRRTAMPAHGTRDNTPMMCCPSASSCLQFSIILPTLPLTVPHPAQTRSARSRQAGEQEQEGMAERERTHPAAQRARGMHTHAPPFSFVK
jgi:hypothetical protein